MALNDSIIPIERFESIALIQGSSVVMTLRMTEFLEAITRQVNQNIPLTYSGSPEGNLSAEPYKLCIDTTNDALYYKKTGAEATGWQLL